MGPIGAAPNGVDNSLIYQIFDCDGTPEDPFCTVQFDAFNPGAAGEAANVYLSSDGAVTQAAIPAAAGWQRRIRLIRHG